MNGSNGPVDPEVSEEDEGRRPKNKPVETLRADQYGENTPARKTTSRLQPIFGLSLVCLGVALVTTFSPPPIGVNTGRNGTQCADTAGNKFALAVCICPRVTVCAKDWRSVSFLVFARASAYFDYPLYVALFLSKAHNLRAFLHQSYVSTLVDMGDPHHLHTLAGTIVSLEVFWHASWHLLRWGLAGEIHLVWTHVTGRSGLVALAITPLITWPMMFQGLRRRVAFEWRKMLHYLSIVWALALCFHAPTQHISKIMGAAVGVYLVDYVYGLFVRVHFVPTLTLRRLSTAVEVTFKNPTPDFNKGGYVYVCLPWISKTQWHPFSLFQMNSSQGESSICMSAVGDWTKAVHAELKRPSSRPAYIYGPFPSPFSCAAHFDHLICVASGIGITPSLQVAASFQETRDVNLVWVCRESDLIEWYINKASIDVCQFFIFYTGERDLNLSKTAMELLRTKPMLKIFQGRPNLSHVIRSIIDAATFGTELPKDLLKAEQQMRAKIFNSTPESRFNRQVQSLVEIYSPLEIFEMAVDYSHSPGLEPSQIRDTSTTCYGGPLHRAPSTGERRRLDGLGVTIGGFKRFVLAMSQGVDRQDTLVDLDTEIEFARADGNETLDVDGFKSFLADFVLSIESVRETERGELSKLEGSRSYRRLVSRSSRVAPIRGTLTRSSSFKDLIGEDIGRSDPEVVHIDGNHPETEINHYNWQVLYCGGTPAVVEKLQKICHECRIGLQVESYRW